MANYKIVYRMVGEVVLQADTEEDAREQFWELPMKTLHDNVHDVHMTDSFLTNEETTEIEWR